MSIATVTTGKTDVNLIRAHRFDSIFTPPEHWVDERFDSTTANLRAAVTVQEQLCLPYTPSFQKGSGILTIKDTPGNLPTLSFKDPSQEVGISLENVTTGKNNFKIHDIAITEHVAALFEAFGLAINCTVTAPSFPTPDEGLQFLVDPLASNLIETRKIPTIYSVREPVAVQFGDGNAYVLFEPPTNDGNPGLTIDTQFSHPQNALGTQRAVVDVTPAVFAYIASARTPSYGLRKALLTPGGLFGAARMHFVNIEKSGVVLVGKTEIENPKAKFEHEGINREAIMHEVIDKLAAVALLPGRFAGRVTFNRTNHSRDIQAMRVAIPHLVEL